MVEARNESEALVIRFFERLDEGDLEGIRSLLHEDASWVAKLKSIPDFSEPTVGRDAVVDDFLNPIRGLFEPGQPKVDVLAVVGSDSQVMAETRGVGRVVRNGKEYDNDYAWAFEIRDGLIYAVREYFDGGYVQSVVFD